MKKKLFSLMMLCLFAFAGVYAQSYVVGHGTAENENLPTHSYYKYGLTQQIYTAEELGPGDTITSIAFYNAGSQETRKLNVYMVLTDKEAFESNTDWIVPTAANQVYSDTAVVFGVNQWTELTLSTPFVYDGEHNIAVIVSDTTGGYTTSPHMSCLVTPGASQALFVHSDATNYNPLDPNTPGSGTAPATPYNGTVMDVKNQIRFTGINGPLRVVDLPTNSYYKFTVSQQIFTPEDLGSIAEVGSVSFFNMGIEQTRNLDVYMTLVDTLDIDGAFHSTTDWVVVDSTDLVFSGDVTFGEFDWTKITFDTSFVYDGYSYVVLTVDDNTDVAIEGLNFRVEETADTMAMFYHSDDSTRFNPNPTDITVEGTMSGVRNLVTFGSFMYDITVVNGNETNSYVPVYGLYADYYQKAEFIIPADSLVDAAYGTIGGMKFYASNANVSWDGAQFQVFLKEVPATTIDAFNGTTGATVVYEGSLSIVNNEMAIEFTTEFPYQNGNLLVGVYETSTTSDWEGCSWYGVITTGASVQGYNYSSLSGVSPTQRNFIPKTSITYAPGIAPVTPLDPDLYFMENGNVLTTLDLGYRPNGAWMRPASWYLYNMTGREANVRDHDFTPNPDYFSLVDPEVPFTMAAEDSILMSFTTDTALLQVDSIISRQFAVMYDTRSAAVWHITAHAYEPVENDVYELATELDFDDLPFIDSLHVYDSLQNRVLYDNYQMLPFDTVPGLENNDAVYKLTFDHDVVLDAYVYGQNAKIALYTEDFYEDEFGIPGPDLLNTYTGPVVGLNDTPAGGDYDVVVGDSTGTTSTLPFYTLYNYSISQQLYLAPELEEAGVEPGIMSQIGFLTYSNYTYTEQGIKIWMANVNDAALGATTLSTAGMTLVYEGECTPEVGWNMFDIEAAGFEWDGVSNVLISVQRNNGSWHSGPYWVRTSTNFVSGLANYRDSAPYDMAAETYEIASYYQYQNRAVTRFVSGVPNREYANNNNGYYHYSNNRGAVANNRGNRDQQTIIEQGFEDGLGDWTMNNCHSSSGVSYSYGGNTGSYAFRFYYTEDYPQYLISPELDDNDGGNITFYAARYSSSYPETFKVGYSSTTNDPSEFTWYDEVTCTTMYGTGAYQEYSYDFPAGTKYVSIACTSDNQFYLFIDDIVITAEIGGGGGSQVVNVTIGEGTSLYYYYPVNMYFEYSLTEQLYTADEIGTGEGTINAISFYYDYTSSFSMNNVTLYMKNVTRESFADNTDMEPLAESDIVWTGTLSATESGWITITLDTPFAYSGGNLLVGGFDGTSGYPGSSFKFRTSTCEAYKGITWYSDTYTPDPYNTASGFSGTKMYTQYRNNIQLNITTSGGGTVTMYTVTTEVNPEDAGEVTGGGEYAEGANVQLVATPNEGWVFVDWNDGVTESTREFIATENITFTANFEHESYVTPAEPGMAFNFEGGEYGWAEDWPSNWTVDPAWYIDTAAHTTTHVPVAKQGHSAFFEGTTPADTADMVLPAIDFVGYSELAFDYIATGTNTLEVLYGPTTSHLTSLWAAPTSSTTWTSATIDLSELGDIRSENVIVFRAIGGSGVTGIDNIRNNNYGIADAYIEGMPVEAGTYYLVVSSTDLDFEVRIEAEDMYCPMAAEIMAPADDADGVEPRRVDLTWVLGEYTTEYRLVFGTTYYCEDVLVDWTSDLAQNYTVRNLLNNTNYFWRVDQRNSECEVLGEVWGFTTHLNVPQNLHLEDESIFVGQDAVVLWDNIQDRTFRQYNIYVDGQMIGHTPTTYIPDQFLSYAIDSLGYNMNPGYMVQVSALYDEGESALSEPLMVKVSGNGTMTGYVYEMDGTTGIAGATVTFTGKNEFGEDSTYVATTNAAGRYTIAMQASYGNDADSYTAQAECEGYQGPVAPMEGNPRPVVYNQTTQANFIMDELFLPVGNVWAEYYPDPEDDDEYVKVFWSMAGNGPIGDEFTVCDGTSTSSYIPLYGLWHDDYTRTETVYPAELLAPLAGTQITSLKYYISTSAYSSWDPASFNVYLKEVPSTAINSYYGSEGATVVYSGSLDGQGEEMLITFTTPYTYNGGNLLVGIEEPVVGTYSSCYFYGIESSGSSASGYSSSSLSAVTFNQRNFLPKTTFNAGRSIAATANAGQGDRAFHHYRIYRTNCYNDGPYNSDNTVMLASDWPTDTLYIDTNFDTVQPGVYKWGVSCIYQGNRTVDYPNGRESDIVWSNCLDKDMYLNNVDITVLLNSADPAEGVRVSFVNVNDVEQELYPMPAITLDETGFYAWDSFRRGTYEITVSKPGYETITETRVIWDETHLRYVMIELLTPVTNLYVSRTGWAMWEPVVAGGAGGSFIDFETGDLSQFDFDNTSAYPWIVSNQNSYEGSYCMKSSNGGIASSTSAISAVVDYNAGGNVNFAALCQGEGTSTFWDKCIFEIDGVEQFAYGANVNGWNEYSYEVGAGSHTFTWKYTKDSSVNPTGDAMWVDNIEFEGGRVRSFGDERHLEGYKVMCTALDGEQIYNHNTINLEPFCQLATTTSIGEPLIEGAHYICKVAAIYSTGQSPWTEVEWEYEPCDHWGPVDEVTVSTMTDGNFIEWTFENGYNPYDPTNGGGAKGGDDNREVVYGGANLETGMLTTGLYALNITDIDNFDERVYFIGNMLKDNRFEVIVDKNNGVYLIAPGKNTNEGQLEANVNAFRAANAAAFAQMDKEQAADAAAQLKAEMPYEYVNSLMMDIYARSRENNLCALADPFCTDNGMYEFPAGVNAGSGEDGPDYNCLYTTPNPAWYYMRIGEPGSIDIYMYSTPSVDIDFCCWGPFDDPVSPCPNGLTGDKVVSCSYSAAPTEHCMIPANAQTGEYYILVITNYSNQACNINFSAVGGNGSTDCGILPPVDIIGFLITQDGEYLDIVGPTVREYTDLAEYGDHEYCVRPIYPGTMENPSNNFGWSMGCPVCEFSNGEMTCAPGAPISGTYLYEEGGDFGALITWGEQEPTPQPGENFVEDFESGELGEWIAIRNGEGTEYTDWRVVNSETLFQSGPIPAHSGVYVAMSRSWNSSAYNVDNWLISPQVTLDGTLSYWALDDGQYHEYYDVYVSTTTNDINAFSLLYEAPTPTGDWMEYTVDLSAYAGQQGYIAFRHQSYDGDYLFIDDVTIDYGRSNRSDIIAYNVYRSTDNVGYSLIATVPATDEDYYEYFDITAAGTYYYQVTAVYDNGCESEPAPSMDDLDLDYVIVTVTGIDDLNGKVALYPNPTNGLVKIEAQGMRHITVVSVLGQVVYDTELSADEYELNMAQWNAGVYMVRIATENGVSTQRVTVVK